MKKSMLILTAAALLFALLPTAFSEPLPPVETRPANADYRPAFSGQTRAPGMKTETPYEVNILTEELDSPWAVEELPDGRLVITEHRGTVRLYSPETGLSAPITGIPNVAHAGQGGLLDVLPAPGFNESRELYFTLSHQMAGGSVTALGRGTLSPDETAIENFEILWRAMPADGSSGHFGSRVAMDRDGHLFVSTGDRQSGKNRPLAQRTDNGYGKIIRLNQDGTPAPDPLALPFPDGLPEIWSIGHRNVQGLAIHPETGALWASEMGPRGGDELNLIEPGNNYGWPVIGYGLEYSGAKVGEGLTQKAGMEQPVYYWDPVLAASGMDFYAASALPEWQNDLFIGGLAGSHISRLKLDNNRVIGEERLLESEGQRFRDIKGASDGALYAVTDEGRLYRLAPAGQ